MKQFLSAVFFGVILIYRFLFFGFSLAVSKKNEVFALSGEARPFASASSEERSDERDEQRSKLFKAKTLGGSPVLSGLRPSETTERRMTD